MVVPSFNQVEFLSATLDSVLSYDGPCEVIVMDGGSDDGSVETLARYGPRLTHWQSASDGGQAEAINAGFARASGDVLCWLNSDDMHLPGTLSRVAAAAGNRPRRFFRYGSAVHLREKPDVQVHLAQAQPDENDRLLHDAVVVQPSAFWSRDVWEATGPLDADMHFAFDWEWFIRARSHANFEHVSEVYSVYRLHEGHKTGSGGASRRSEICEVVSRHGREPWVSRYRRLLALVADEESTIIRLQQRGMSFHRAALLAAALRGSIPRSAEEARAWSFILRMYS